MFDEIMNKTNEFQYTCVECDCCDNCDNINDECLHCDLKTFNFNMNDIIVDNNLIEINDLIYDIDEFIILLMFNDVETLTGVENIKMINQNND